MDRKWSCTWGEKEVGWRNSVERKELKSVKPDQVLTKNYAMKVENKRTFEKTWGDLDFELANGTEKLKTKYLRIE